MRAVVVATVVALLPAAWLGTHRWLAADDTTGRVQPSDGVSSDLPIPPVAPPSTREPSTRGPSTPGPGTPTPSGTPPRLPEVAPDAPRRLQAGTLIDTGFDSAVTTIEPASTTEVARWGSRGSPGSPGTDTVYVVGAIRASGSAFARLPALAAGNAVTIRTDSGTLTYTVRTTGLKPETGLATDPLFTEHVPGRLVLVGIRYAASGDRQRDALVVTAELTGAESA